MGLFGPPKPPRTITSPAIESPSRTPEAPKPVPPREILTNNTKAVKKTKNAFEDLGSQKKEKDKSPEVRPAIDPNTDKPVDKTKVEKPTPTPEKPEDKKVEKPTPTPEKPEDKKVEKPTPTPEKPEDKKVEKPTPTPEKPEDKKVEKPTPTPEKPEDKKVEKPTPTPEKPEDKKVEKPTPTPEKPEDKKVEKPTPTPEKPEDKKVEKPTPTPEKPEDKKVEKPTPTPEKLEDKKVEKPTPTPEKPEDKKVEKPTPTPEKPEDKKVEKPTPTPEKPEDKKVEKPTPTPEKPNKTPQEEIRKAEPAKPINRTEGVPTNNSPRVGSDGMTDYIRRPGLLGEQQKLIDSKPDTLSNKERTERGRLMATHSDPKVRLEHDREVASMDLAGAKKNVETARRELENRSFLEKSADALTGFSSEKMLKTNLKEAEKREKNLASRSALLNENTEGKSQQEVQNTINAGKKSSQNAFQSATEGNKKIQTMAETSALRAERGGQVAEVVQDVNAGLAYVGGFALGGHAGGIGATAYARSMGGAVESATQSYLNGDNTSDVVKNAALGGGIGAVEGVVEGSIYAVGGRAAKTILTKTGSKILAGAGAGSVVSGGIATEREIKDIAQGGNSTIGERVERVATSTVIGGVSGGALSKVATNPIAQAAGGAVIGAGASAAEQFHRTGKIDTGSTILAAGAGATGALGAHHLNTPQANTVPNRTNSYTRPVGTYEGDILYEAPRRPTPTGTKTPVDDGTHVDVYFAPEPQTVLGRTPEGHTWVPGATPNSMQLLVPMSLPTDAPSGTQPLFREASIQEFQKAISPVVNNNQNSTQPTKERDRGINRTLPEITPLEPNKTYDGGNGLRISTNTSQQTMPQTTLDIASPTPEIKPNRRGNPPSPEVQAQAPGRVLGTPENEPQNSHERLRNVHPELAKNVSPSDVSERMDPKTGKPIFGITLHARPGTGNQATDSENNRTNSPTISRDPVTGREKVRIPLQARPGTGNQVTDSEHNDTPPTTLTRNPVTGKEKVKMTLKARPGTGEQSSGTEHNDVQPPTIYRDPTTGKEKIRITLRARPGTGNQATDSEHNDTPPATITRDPVTGREKIKMTLKARPGTGEQDPSTENSAF